MKLFVEHLTVIDSAYLHPQHGIVGESWIVDATLHGDLNPESMVMDFGHVKKQLKAAIDGSIDHTLIAPRDAVELSGDAAQLTLTYRFGAGEYLVHRTPSQAVTLLPGAQVTDQAMIRWLETMLMEVVPANVSRVEIALRHEDEAPAHYHYAHGLKKHDGNCQRIAHGHRSRIMVWRNEARDETLERIVAQRMNYAYLATRTDKTGETGGNSEFGYTSDQGEFFLSYPTARCRLLETDSTVECIAEYLLAELMAEHAAQHVRVRAYEGVHKGAMAETA